VFMHRYLTSNSTNNSELHLVVWSSNISFVNAASISDMYNKELTDLQKILAMCSPWILGRGSSLFCERCQSE
jgi:hypothetical protein